MRAFDLIIRSLGPSPVAQLLARPGAVGRARFTRGAAGYPGPIDDIQIFNPSNLNASGAGSVQEALESNQPAYVLPIVGGEIAAGGGIAVEGDYKTLAFNTAPGDGIIFWERELRINASQVICMGANVRINDQAGGPSGDAISVITSGGNPISNIYFFRCTGQGARDENWSTNGLNGNIDLLTLDQCYSVLALNDNNHAMGYLLNKSGVDGVDVINSVAIHTRERNLQISIGVQASQINNYVYNWERKGTSIAPEVLANLIGNKYKDGPVNKAGAFAAIEFAGSEDWNSGLSYNAGQVVHDIGSGGDFYESLVSGNLNNDPSTSPAQWRLMSPAQVYINDVDDNGSPSLITLTESAPASWEVGTPHNFDVGYSAIASSAVEAALITNHGLKHVDTIMQECLDDAINGTELAITNNGDPAGGLLQTAKAKPAYNNANNSVYPAHNLGVHLDWLVSSGYAVDTAAAAAMTKNQLLSPGNTGYPIIEEFIDSQW